MIRLLSSQIYNPFSEGLITRSVNLVSKSFHFLLERRHYMLLQWLKRMSEILRHLHASVLFHPLTLGCEWHGNGKVFRIFWWWWTPMAELRVVVGLYWNPISHLFWRGDAHPFLMLSFFLQVLPLQNFVNRPPKPLVSRRWVPLAIFV